MKKTKGFTLIELLVVIAIIALLLAIIMPALKRAKDFGMRVVCSSTLKQFGVANEMYAQQYDGAYVPISYNRNNSGTFIHWMRNDVYRSLLDLESYRGSEETSSYDFPDKLLCPADKISRDPANISDENVLTSYAYNATDWGGFGGINNPTIGHGFEYSGHKQSNITLPAERLAFVDGIDWWTNWDPQSADPARGWDQYGQMSIMEYRAVGVYGPVIYRHSDGANVGFYDGHVEYFTKDKLFVSKDFNTKPKKPGMWVANLKLYYQRVQ